MMAVVVWRDHPRPMLGGNRMRVASREQAMKVPAMGKRESRVQR